MILNGMRQRIAAVALAGALAFAGACASNGDEEVKPAPDKQTTLTQGERKDLISFKTDDRSQAGFKDIWVTWEIKNNSSEKSDYSWDWEAIGTNGDRVENSTEYVTDVLPGQTTKGEMPTTLQDQDVKLNITNFERSRSY